MNNTFDGKSFKRTANKAGEKVPVTGVKKDRAVYIATGGETSINLAVLTPALDYNPGQNMISVKRSSVSVMISGVNFFESSPTSISFPQALLADEVVEITKEVTVTSVMAANPRPDLFSYVAQGGETEITADFPWYFNQNPTKARGAVHVEVGGVGLYRGNHYLEVAVPNTSMTNKIQLNQPLTNGQVIVLKPTNQVIDQHPALTTFQNNQFNTINNRLDTVESIVNIPAAVYNRARVENPTSEYTTSSTSAVPVPGMSFNINLTQGHSLLVLLNMKLFIESGESDWYRVSIQVVGPNGYNQWIDAVNDNGFHNFKQRSISFSEWFDGINTSGQYTVTLLWCCDANSTNNVLKQRFGMSLTALEV
jgi:hypothetical protein